MSRFHFFGENDLLSQRRIVGLGLLLFRPLCRFRQDCDEISIYCSFNASDGDHRVVVCRAGRRVLVVRFGFFVTFQLTHFFWRDGRKRRGAFPLPRHS